MSYTYIANGILLHQLVDSRLLVYTPDIELMSKYLITNNISIETINGIIYCNDILLEDMIHLLKSYPYPDHKDTDIVLLNDALIRTNNIIETMEMNDDMKRRLFVPFH